MLQPVLPHVIKLLLSDSNVVHSYAATLMERVMAMHEDGRQRFTPQDMAPFLQPLLDNLFKCASASHDSSLLVCQLPAAPAPSHPHCLVSSIASRALEQPDSEENEYVMKCIMRVVVFLREAVAPVATVFLEMLSKLLLVSCANPRNPAFSHFMFESIAGILRHTLPSRPELAGTFEGLLFPAIDVVLQKDIQEYAPYAFQVVALLLELRPLPAPPVYVQLLPPLLTPHLWEDQGNIPALVRLLR